MRRDGLGWSKVPPTKPYMLLLIICFLCAVFWFFGHERYGRISFTVLSHIIFFLETWTFLSIFAFYFTSADTQVLSSPSVLPNHLQLNAKFTLANSALFSSIIFRLVQLTLVCHI